LAREEAKKKSKNLFTPFLTLKMLKITSFMELTEMLSGNKFLAHIFFKFFVSGTLFIYKIRADLDKARQEKSFSM